MKKHLIPFIPLLVFLAAGQCEDTERSTDTWELKHAFEVTDQLEFVTSMGTFTVGLYGEDAPVTVANFLQYVDEKAYDDIIFHRVIADFMVQTGMFTSNEEAVANHDPIALEIIPGLKHTPGVISMARTEDPNSASNQFFVCVSAKDTLDGQYAAFGMVEMGYEVVEAISLVETTSVGAYDDVPMNQVIIESVRRIQ